MLRSPLLATVLSATAAITSPFSLALAQAGADVVIEKSGGRDRIVVAGLEDKLVRAVEAARFDVDTWRTVFAVRVDAGTGEDVPAMLGDYRINDGRVVFEPRFPLQPGLAYRVEFDTSRAPGGKLPAARLTKVLKIPAAAAAPPARVAAVYPSRDVLPENRTAGFTCSGTTESPSRTRSWNWGRNCGTRRALGSPSSSIPGESSGA
jgi:hypothetical protein